MAALRCIALALGLLALAAATAEAHRIPFPKRDLLRLDRERVEVIVSYDVDEGEDAWWIRDRLDPDGNGTIDAQEARGAERLLAADVVRPVRLTVDGRRLDLRITAISCDGLEPDGERGGRSGEGDEGRLEPGGGRDLRGIGITVVLEAALPRNGSAMRLRFEDRIERAGHPVVVGVQSFDRRIRQTSSGRLVERADRGIDAVLGVEVTPGVPFVAILEPRP